MASWSFAAGGTYSEELMTFYGQDQSNQSFKRAAFGLTSQEVLRLSKKARVLEEGEVEGEGDEGEQLCNPRQCKKRRLTVDQVRVLEEFFEEDNKLEPERKALIAKRLGLQARQVAIWFQNRRARWKTKQLEQAFDLLKSRLESALHDNKDILKQKDCVAQENKRLQEEVHRLKALVDGSGGSRVSTSSDENGDGDGDGDVDVVAAYAGTIRKDDTFKEEIKEEEQEEVVEDEEEEEELQEFQTEDGSCSSDGGAKSDFINSPTVKVGYRGEVQDSCRSYPFLTNEEEPQQETSQESLHYDNSDHGYSLGVLYPLIKLEDPAASLCYSSSEDASSNWLNHHYPFVLQQLATTTSGAGGGAPYFEDAYTFLTDQCVNLSWCD